MSDQDMAQWILIILLLVWCVVITNHALSLSNLVHTIVEKIRGQLR